MKIKLIFPEWILNQKVDVYLEEEGEAGPTTSLLFSGLANYAPKSQQLITSEKEGVMLTGTLIFKGDLNPGKKIDGFVVVDGEKKQIRGTFRPKNPDGSVFSTELTV